MTRILFCLLVGLFLMAGCRIQEDPVASYVHVMPFTLEAAGDAGDHKIVDGWFYANGEFLGAYSLPATIPVIAEGETDIVLFPGVKENGISTTPNIYPFLLRFEDTLNLSPTLVDTLRPHSVYDPNTVFPWDLYRGSFDGGSTLVLANTDGDPGNAFEITSDGAYEGNSLMLEVDTLHPLLYVGTEYVNLPATFERQVWLEMHHHNDIPFLVYVVGDFFGSEVSFPVYQFNPTEGEWNKIYFNITEALIAISEGIENYRLEFRAILPTNLDGEYTQPRGEVRIDNIRLAHF